MTPKVIKTVQVTFQRPVGLGPARFQSARTYTYIVPQDADIDEGDEVLVPVTIPGTDKVVTRQATVDSVGELEFKYVIGKVVKF